MSYLSIYPHAMNVKFGANLDWTSLDCTKSDQYFTTWNSNLNGINAKDIRELNATNIFEEYRNLDYKGEQNARENTLAEEVICKPLENRYDGGMSLYPFVSSPFQSSLKREDSTLLSECFNLLEYFPNKLKPLEYELLN